MPVPKDKDLTIKQKKFVKAYVANDGNGRVAYKQAYGVTNDNTAATEASTTLKKPNVKQAIELALEKHHITLDAAMRPIADGLKASKILPDGDGGVIDTPDHTNRLKASGMALKLLGADKQEVNTINFNFKSNNTTFNAGAFKK